MTQPVGHEGHVPEHQPGATTELSHGSRLDPWMRSYAQRTAGMNAS